MTTTTTTKSTPCDLTATRNGDTVTIHDEDGNAFAYCILGDAWRLAADSRLPVDEDLAAVFEDVAWRDCPND